MHFFFFSILIAQIHVEYYKKFSIVYLKVEWITIKTDLPAAQIVSSRSKYYWNGNTNLSPFKVNQFLFYSHKRNKSNRFAFADVIYLNFLLWNFVICFHSSGLKLKYWLLLFFACTVCNILSHFLCVQWWWHSQKVARFFDIKNCNNLFFSDNHGIEICSWQNVVSFFMFDHEKYRLVYTIA